MPSDTCYNKVLRVTSQFSFSSQLLPGTDRVDVFGMLLVDMNTQTQLPPLVIGKCEHPRKRPFTSTSVFRLWYISSIFFPDSKSPFTFDMTWTGMARWNSMSKRSSIYTTEGVRLSVRKKEGKSNPKKHTTYCITVHSSRLYIIYIQVSSFLLLLLLYTLLHAAAYIRYRVPAVPNSLEY